jgi:aminopeptidase N
MPYRRRDLYHGIENFGSEEHLRAWTRQSAPPRFNDPSLPEHYPPDLELLPTHLFVDLYVSIPARSVGGRVTTTLRAQRGGLHTLRLDAVDFDDLHVRDLDDQPLNWQYDGRTLEIHWEKPFAAQEIRKVEIAYRVVSPVAGLYFALPDQAYPNQPSYMLSDHETELARHWLPCVDHPNVRTTLDLRLRADARFTILANGYLVEELQQGDGTKTAHWRLEQPCPSYLICIAIGEFVEASDGTFLEGDASTPVAYYAGIEHSADDLRRTFAPTKRMLEWMTSLLNLAYPYPKYYQIALPLFGGAMENITLVTWSDSFVQDALLAREIGWHVNLINVHEMAHVYFGDAVVCRDFAHAWLKESWATYVEQLWQEEVEGADGGQYVYFRNRAYYLEETEEYQRPLVTHRFQSSWDLYDAHLYEGGACRLDMLRHELGSETFWAAVRDYLQRYLHQVVETDDFRRVLEEHSGRSLGKFFDQWFRSPGYPDLKVSFEYNSARQEGTFTIEQKQADKEKGIPVFEFNTEIEWTSGSNSQRRAIHIHSERQLFVVPMASKPDQVRFDPDHKVLYRLEFNPGDPMLRAQLHSAPDVIGRIEAAQALAKTAKHINIQAIADAFLQEPYWGVRCEFATILGNANHATAIEALAHLIRVESEPRVMVRLLRAAANYRSPLINAAIQARLQSTLGPLSQQAAYIALGKQREQAPLDILTGAAARVGRDGRAQAGAFTGLGESRQESALNALLNFATYGGSPNRARHAAARALGTLGKSLEPHRRATVIEKLSDLLRDPWHAVAWGAAHALGTLGEPSAIPALESYGQSLSRQEQAAVNRIIEDLRRKDKVDGSAQQKQVDELREKLRTLEQQIQTLSARLESEKAEVE